MSAAQSDAACQPSAQTDPPTPTHPFLLFSKSEAPRLAERKNADSLLADCWERLEQAAQQPDDLDDWAPQLEARAFLFQITGDESSASRAIALMQAALKQTDPVAYYKHADFHHHAVPLRALALAWDWLFEKMTPAQRAEILPALERWCDTVYNYTERRWWREASYNVGAIPIGGLGILATAIRPDSTLPATTTWYREAVRRIGQNFFPLSWKPSGICWEGPNYAIVGLRYAAQFAEMLRRAGGPDLLADSGALNAAQYLMYQWLPHGGCAPIGDNTSYGRRTFAAEYLLTISRSRDATGLWTWRTYTDTRRLDPLITYLWYPLDLKPVSPLNADLPTSRYFEVTQNRAGYTFGRTGWNSPDAAFFSFATRFEKSNHQHYDMNSFLFGGFGTLFATHRLLYPYGHPDHGVDREHNLVIVDGGGWPAYDKLNSCGDDNSTDGLLVGLTLGPFADYTRGDAKWSYRDNTILNANPAIRAERACLFVKAGLVPYVLILDDLQYRQNQRRYDWLWYAPDLPIAGTGKLDDPLLIAAQQGSCALHFITPAKPTVIIQPAESIARRRRRPQAPLRRISVAQQASRVRYAVLATLQQDLANKPTVRLEPVRCAADSAGAVRLQFPDGTVDYIAWQSEEEAIQVGSPLHAGPLQTNGLLAMVRIEQGRITGYLLGEGSYLRYNDTTLVRARSSICISAAPDRIDLQGRRRAREGLAPEPPQDPHFIKLPLPLPPQPDS